MGIVVGPGITVGEGITISAEIDPWNISKASYLQQYAQAQGTSPQGLWFRSDGLLWYMADNNNSVYQYTMAIPWNISTSTFVASIDTTASGSQTRGVFFKPDGLQMYLVKSNNRRVHQYTLGTAWDVTSATEQGNISVISQDSSPTDLFMHPDGTYLYVIGNANDNVYEYSLLTPWLLTSAVYVRSKSVSEPHGLYFRPDGTALYVITQTSDIVLEYTMSPAWDISTASFSQLKVVAAQELQCNAVHFSPDGANMYVTGQAQDRVSQYQM